jgi:serine/threonine protein kinase
MADFSFIQEVPMQHRPPARDYEMASRLSDEETTDVWSAVHRPTGTRVAIKFPKENCSQTTREVELASRIEHNGILPLLDTIQSQFGPILVYPLCEGGDLLNFIVANGPLSEEEAKVVATELLSAVAYLHSQLIWHRDIKPENLLLLSDEITPGTIKLTDLGLAVDAKGDVLDGDWMGTKAYAAPEMRQHRPYTRKVDSYSIGRTLYAALSGRLPEEFIDLEHLGWEFSLSRDCTKFLRKLLNEDPDRRISVEEARSHRWLNDVQLSNGFPADEAG